MGKSYTGESIRRATGCDNAKIAKVTASAVDVLSIAASPTFAIMALLTGALSAGAPDMLCSATHHATPLNGMVMMYLLMSAFHLSPWLKLISSRLGGCPQ
jgi:hypothetical protein